MYLFIQQAVSFLSLLSQEVVKAGSISRFKKRQKKFMALIQTLNGLSVDVASNTHSTTNANAEEAGSESHHQVIKLNAFATITAGDRLDITFG